MELRGGQVLTGGEKKEWSARKTRSLMEAQRKADLGSLRPGRTQASDGVGGGGHLVMFHYVRVCLGWW